MGFRISNPHEMIEPHYLRDCIARTSERFTKHQQEVMSLTHNCFQRRRIFNYRLQDSHEYLSLCLNKLHQDAVDVSNEFSDNCFEAEAKLCPVDDNFQCRVQSTLSCTQCSWKSTHYEIFRDLSLNLPDSSEWQYVFIMV
jgi:ubiquitin C-terminal hydrolase